MQKQRAEPDLRILSKKQAGGGLNIPRDIGLLPATYIPPPLSTLPKSPVFLANLLYRHIRFKLRDFSHRAILKYGGPRLGAGKRFWQIGRAKVRHPKRSQVKKMALALYSDVYQAFAQKDVKKLRKICADGLLGSMTEKMRGLGGERVEWEMRLKGARVVGHRVVNLGVEGIACRQCVVRIDSVQKLTRWRSGQVVEGSGRERGVREFFVVQRMMKGWEEGRWDAWGMVEPTDPEVDFERWREEGLM
ncbi:hypothetical protein GLAREA_12015 [Glarea lozoyensis ATCC 20868]|uniref:Large ribosomal subunit protein mL45 n=1 Tax=Glarea lozoyensis (strain ATCC 20868 / MF5171) TaxID=1116229 RepID=S3E060_GLAL2|nr:uncharacterized protein GLAREA_12015 [Glarea lozoyensis ATCC 20868]EPE31933.1 hypothetical protein GLAREA_12015 [Glarea lozoyensis ATCC 20868]